LRHWRGKRMKWGREREEQRTMVGVQMSFNRRKRKC
jgi:hypothetical protein